MRTSRPKPLSRKFRKATITLFFSAISLAIVGTNCLSGDECLRYSDCSEGLTCAFGKCVVPAPQSGDEGGTSEGGSTPPDSSTPPSDSGVTPADSGSSDLDSGDASNDDASDAADD